MEEDKKKITFVVLKEFLTCVNCDLCYNQNNEPRFCQEYSLEIDPLEKKDNLFRASKCDYWIPNPRGKSLRKWMGADAPEHKRWYED